jgi:hypothetical protein
MSRRMVSATKTTRATLLRERNGRYAFAVQLEGRSARMYYRPDERERAWLDSFLGDTIDVFLEHGGISRLA